MLLFLKSWKFFCLIKIDEKKFSKIVFNGIELAKIYLFEYQISDTQYKIWQGKARNRT